MQVLTAVVFFAFWILTGNNPPGEVFYGEISDTQCALNVHSTNSSHDDLIKTKSGYGDTPEECTRTCVKNGGKYVLLDVASKKVYRLDNQTAAADFAGKEVRVRGVYDKDNKLLHVLEIKAK
jgi:hypothetical protein